MTTHPTPNSEYQRWYVLFAAAHDRTPADQHADDIARWPGGPMAGYVIWIDERWHEYFADQHLPSHTPTGPHLDTFARWLEVSFVRA